mmetsp:Transcript_11121/g.35471  ORF Transcript_11121/g.35471 Transcript_11121/m.35471 type:complete len:204 (-) Transcript_11121:1270-1881(-)
MRLYVSRVSSTSASIRISRRVPISGLSTCSAFAPRTESRRASATSWKSTGRCRTNESFPKSPSRPSAAVGSSQRAEMTSGRELVAATPLLLRSMRSTASPSIATHSSGSKMLSEVVSQPSPKRGSRQQNLYSRSTACTSSGALGCSAVTVAWNQRGGSPFRSSSGGSGPSLRVARRPASVARGPTWCGARGRGEGGTQLHEGG